MCSNSYLSTSGSVAFVNQVVGSTLNITGVQLEKVSTGATIGTDFEFLPADVSMVRCQRYLRPIGRMFGIAVSPTAMKCFSDGTVMRTESPSLIVTNSIPSGESPIGVTVRSSTGIAPSFNWYAFGSVDINFNGFSGLTAQQTALINQCVVLSAQL